MLFNRCVLKQLYNPLSIPLPTNKEFYFNITGTILLKKFFGSSFYKPHTHTQNTNDHSSVNQLLEFILVCSSLKSMMISIHQNHIRQHKDSAEFSVNFQRHGYPPTLSLKTTWFWLILSLTVVSKNSKIMRIKKFSFFHV